MNFECVKCVSRLPEIHTFFYQKGDKNFNI